MTAKYQQLSSQVTTQTQIRNSEHLANTTKKPGSKTQTYAAVTAERLPIKHKPKSTPNLQPITQTKYPCTKYIITATILTTTEKKYTEKLELAPRYKTIEAYTDTLPKLHFSFSLPVLITYYLSDYTGV